MLICSPDTTEGCQQHIYIYIYIYIFKSSFREYLKSLVKLLLKFEVKFKAYQIQVIYSLHSRLKSFLEYIFLDNVDRIVHSVISLSPSQVK